MDLKRTWAIFRKELIHIRRDYQSLVQVVLLPVILLILYGYALTFDIKNVPTAVYDQENSRISQDFLRNFKGTKYFDLRYRVTSFNDIRRRMDAREISLALVIPYDFSRYLKSGQTAKIQAILDGSDANTANIIQGYVQGVVQAFNQDILIERLNRRGVSQAKPPVTAGIRFWFNEDLESKNFIIPGLIVIIMTMVGALLTALTIVREVERGSMESLLATPLKKTELILGKLGPYFLLGLLDLGIALAMGEFLFQVPLKGSVTLYIVLSAVFLLVMLGMGMLISITSENQLQAYQMATLTTFLPAFPALGLRLCHPAHAPVPAGGLVPGAGPVPGDHLQGHLFEGGGAGGAVALRPHAGLFCRAFPGPGHPPVPAQNRVTHAPPPALPHLEGIHSGPAGQEAPPVHLPAPHHSAHRLRLRRQL